MYDDKIYYKNNLMILCTYDKTNILIYLYNSLFENVNYIIIYIFIEKQNILYCNNKLQSVCHKYLK